MVGGGGEKSSDREECRGTQYTDSCTEGGG